MPGRILRYILILCLLVAATGCGVFHKAKHRSSSVVEYLYPDRQMRAAEIEPGVARLSLPLKVGIAFVPGNTTRPWALTENDKLSLMKQVAQRFESHKFVDAIELIPSAYLRRRGSFANLDQIQAMYGVDVIALLAYDQTQFTDAGVTSLAYWTIVGAYIVPGEKNATHTMIDATVYDIASRRLLFRAPGIDYIDSRATPVNLSEQLRQDSRMGLQKASEDLVQNLEQQLEQFKQKVKHSPDQYEIEQAQGHGGAGAFGPWLLLLGLLGLFVRYLNSRRTAAGAGCIWTSAND